MAYTGGTLSRVAQTIEGNQGVWVYTTADTLATVLGAGYFSDATARGLQKADIVEVMITGTPVSQDTYVSGITGAAATVSLLPPSFYGTTAPAAQPSGAAQAAITDNSGGAAAATTGVVAVASKRTLIIPLAALSGLANAQVFKLAVPFAFTVTSIGVRVGIPATTAAKAATLTAQVAGAAVTGGVVSLTSANATPTGALVAGTSITAGNIGTAGQTVEAAISSVTAFVEGSGHIEFGITNNDMANSIATMIAQGNAIRSALVAEGLVKGAA